ncbi:MAG: SAM-dependent DNA methyltransferase [Planctomycetota bacterium]|nr:SAM-dependent DNA methyltransferase [Planctomycetota bacterium]
MNIAQARVEFGDFQTPKSLAQSVCDCLARRQVAPATIIEPTCGVGAFLLESLKAFPDAGRALGFDINAMYVASCRQSIADAGHESRCQVAEADFFQTDWPELLDSTAGPLLVIGNPPWVTNSALGAIGSSNLPAKSNFQGRKGLDALMGKSNFDISEWMLLRLLEWLSGRDATMAMLCKTAVARKVLRHAWKHELQIRRAEIHRIDAAADFGAAVDACLFVCFMQPGTRSRDCDTYESLGDASRQRTIGYQEGRLIADVDLYQRWQELAGPSSRRWRSGVKHDCAKVMELAQSPEGLTNGLGESVEIESEYLYPLLKSSDVAKRPSEPPKRWMIVTQTQVGADTSVIETSAPKTWAYLTAHADRLDARGSSIYRKRPRYSVFGVGGYTFAPWKVAISGFYKSLSFAVVGPHQGRPVVFDDTIYAIGCETEREARLLHRMLMSDEAQEFYASLIFWDAKRPITAELLATLSLDQLATALAIESDFREVCEQNPWTTVAPRSAPSPCLDTAKRLV